MSANDDLERRIADFYATEAPPRAPDRVLGSALATIEAVPQRRALVRMPWRFPTMTTNARLAAAALAVLVVSAIGLAVLRPGQAPGGVGTSPSPPASPAISPTASSAHPPLTETFTSTINGISTAYPAGWRVRAASEPWTSGMVTQESLYADVIYEKEADSPFLALASQPLGPTSFDEWAAGYRAAEGAPCGQSQEPVTVDGAPGVIDTGCVMALVSRDGRAYLIWLYRIDDVAWFKEILATVRLQRTAAEFRQAFSYVLPPSDLPWDVSAGEVAMEFRVPDSGGPGRSSFGVLLRAIDGGRVDPCAPSSDALPLAAGPKAVLDYLNTVPFVRVDSRTTTTIGGLPAIRAIVNTAPLQGTCQELRPFAKQVGVEEEEVITQAPPETWIMVSVVDVNGDHIVIWSWADQARFLSLADALIATFRFQTTAASPTASPTG